MFWAKESILEKFVAKSRTLGVGWSISWFPQITPYSDPKMETRLLESGRQNRKSSSKIFLFVQCQEWIKSQILVESDVGIAKKRRKLLENRPKKVENCKLCLEKKSKVQHRKFRKSRFLESGKKVEKSLSTFFFQAHTVRTTAKPRHVLFTFWLAGSVCCIGIGRRSLGFDGNRAVSDNLIGWLGHRFLKRVEQKTVNNLAME